MTVNAKSCLLLYNKNNIMIVKLNDCASTEMMKKQTLEKVAYRINAYFMENNIITTKLCMAQTLLNKNIIIQIINEEEVEKLRREDSWTKLLKTKVELV